VRIFQCEYPAWQKQSSELDYILTRLIAVCVPWLVQCTFLVNSIEGTETLGDRSPVTRPNFFGFPELCKGRLGAARFTLLLQAMQDPEKLD
jgi:hypothetical protein